MNASHAIGEPSTMLTRMTSIDLHRLILLHVTRAAVISLTLLVAGGRLPFDFASSWGWSEMVMAVTALVAAALTPVETRVHRRFILTWNTIALIDLLVGVVVGLRVMFVDHTLASMMDSPILLLPLVCIPLFIASHIVIHLQLRADEYDDQTWEMEPAIEAPPIGARIRYW